MNFGNTFLPTLHSPPIRQQSEFFIMNLDLTINPDFSNVEVDAIFTNLTRFELRLPERRQFFIDNSDLFASFGIFFNEARPFFSRRIGLARDTADNLIQNRILGGARLSGKLNQNWRLGLLNIQTGKDALNEIPSNNNMMFALQRKIAQRSNLGIFMVNREAFGENDFVEDTEKYNRVIFQQVAFLVHPHSIQQST